jgi:hypothetical protein
VPLELELVPGFIDVRARLLVLCFCDAYFGVGARDHLVPASRSERTISVSGSAEEVVSELLRAGLGFLLRT